MEAFHLFIGIVLSAVECSVTDVLWYLESSFFTVHVIYFVGFKLKTCSRMMNLCSTVGELRVASNCTYMGEWVGDYFLCLRQFFGLYILL